LLKCLHELCLHFQHHWSLQNFTTIPLHISKCSSAHNLSCPFRYCSFASIGHADIMFHLWWNLLLSLHLLSFPAFNIFIAWYFVCKARSCAVIILLRVSAFRYPLHSHRNVSSSLIKCLSYFCYTDLVLKLLPIVFLRVMSSSFFLYFMPYFHVSLFKFHWINSTKLLVFRLLI
jgi:hypothetical protein